MLKPKLQPGRKGRKSRRAVAGGQVAIAPAVEAGAGLPVAAGNGNGEPAEYPPGHVLSIEEALALCDAHDICGLPAPTSREPCSVRCCDLAARRRPAEGTSARAARERDR